MLEAKQPRWTNLTDFSPFDYQNTRQMAIIVLLLLVGTGLPCFLCGFLHVS